MRIKLDEVLKDVDGKTPLKIQDGKTITLKDICIQAILTPDEKETPESKYKDYLIYVKLMSEEDDFTIEDIARLKEKIGKIYAPLILGQAWDILENK